MRQRHRWLVRLSVLVVLFGWLPPAVPSKPIPVAAQTSPPPFAVAEPLPLPPDLPPPSLPLPAATSHRAVSSSDSSSDLGSLISQPALIASQSRTVGTQTSRSALLRTDGDSDRTRPLSITTSLVSTCSGDATNPWAWWMRDSTGSFEFLDRSNVDFTDLVNGTGTEKRFYTTDVQAGVLLCIRPTQETLSPMSTQWTTQYYRSATPNGSPTILFATITVLYRGTELINGTSYLAFDVSLNGVFKQKLTGQCTSTIARCYFLAPLAVQGLGMKSYPGSWNAKVTRTNGTPHPDLPVIERELKPIVSVAAPNPIDRQRTTVMTATFTGIPATGWMNTDGGTGKFHLYTQGGQILQELPVTQAFRDTVQQQITYVAQWNNLLSNPTRPITDGNYLVSFFFLKINQPLRMTQRIQWSQPLSN